jgi:hypothetical protein
MEYIYETCVLYARKFGKNSPNLFFSGPRGWEDVPPRLHRPGGGGARLLVHTTRREREAG